MRKNTLQIRKDTQKDLLSLAEKMENIVYLIKQVEIKASWINIIDQIKFSVQSDKTIRRRRVKKIERSINEFQKLILMDSIHLLKINKILISIKILLPSLTI
jgi:Mlc titration factor MtfA (ptsG expression regulator)